MDKKFASRTEIANILDIDRRAFSNYCIGTRKITNIDIRKKLFDLTGIETFKSDTPDARDNVLLSMWADKYIEYPSHRKGGFKYDATKNAEIALGNSKASIEGVCISTDNKYNTVVVPKKVDLKVIITDKNRPFVDIATDLRNWFNNQHTWKTQKEIAENIGVSHSAIKKVFQGVKKPEGSAKQKLYDMTKLECFRDEKQEKIVHNEEKKIYVNKTSTFVDKMNIPIYEVEISIDKESRYTKNLKIPIHDIKTRIVEINDTAEESSSEVTESVSKMGVTANGEIKKLLGEVKEFLEDIKEPVEEVKELLEELKGLVEEQKEPVEEQKGLVEEQKEPVKEHVSNSV